MLQLWHLNLFAGFALQALLCFRALKCRLWSIYPFFYAYLVYTIFYSVVMAIPVVMHNPLYPKLYWWGYLFSGILRFGVAADVYRHIFPPDHALRVRASKVVLCTMLLLTFLFSTFLVPPLSSSAFPDSMRKLALSAALIIVVVLGLARFYWIEIGRNVWGMAAGLLLYTGSELVYLAAMDLWPRLWSVCRYVHPLAFNFMLLAWTIGLWRYYPNPSMRPVSSSAAEDLLELCERQLAQVSNAVRSLVKP